MIGVRKNAKSGPRPRYVKFCRTFFEIRLQFVLNVLLILCKVGRGEKEECKHKCNVVTGKAMDQASGEGHHGSIEAQRLFPIASHRNSRTNGQGKQNTLPIHVQLWSTVGQRMIFCIFWTAHLVSPVSSYGPFASPFFFRKQWPLLLPSGLSTTFACFAALLRPRTINIVKARLTSPLRCSSATLVSFMAAEHTV